ncbi:MAG: hypothetical protein H6745_12330 [Deltaproteobacteria bacterium]|nr:hypothetical protein [Deltaproteobacteria bacterium]
MLSSDGLTRTQFLPLWRDAMWHAPLAERARLVLELGRLTVREEGRAAPLLIAVSEQRDPPLVVMPLAEVPRPAEARLRAAIQEKLARLGASEVYVLVTSFGGQRDGVPAYLLGAWGEAADGDAVAWFMPFRFGPEGLEEATPMVAPDARQTVLARELGGLLVPRH